MTPLQVALVAEVKSHGVPQRVLAERSGLSEKHVSQMMTGTCQGTLTAWQALLDATRDGYFGARKVTTRRAP